MAIIEGEGSQKHFKRPEPASDHITPQRIDRRTALQRLGLAVGATVFLADTVQSAMEADAYWTERNTARRDGSVQFINKDTQQFFPNTATMIYRGFNVDSIDDSGQVLAPYVKRFGQIAAVDYGNTRFDIDEIAENTVNFCKENDIKRINGWGRSMGGMVFTAIAPELKRNDIAIQSVMLESSPASKHDVVGAESYDTSMISIINWMADHNLISYGGDYTRAAMDPLVNFVMRMRDPRKSISGRKSNNEQPNNMVPHQAEFIGDFQITDDQVEALASVPVAYFGTEHGTDDHTVDVMSAALAYQQGLYRSPFQNYGLKDFGHARATVHPSLLGNRMIQARYQMGLTVLPTPQLR